MTGKRTTRCRRCGGMLIESYGERGCSQCGRPYHSRREMHDWYESHRTDITADLRKIGLPATVRKWGIGATTLNKIRHRWGLPVRRYHWVKHRKEGKKICPRQ